jgi:protein phosphatase PTC7
MIISLLRRYQDNTGKLNTTEASKALAEKAELLSNDKDYLSPFSKKARENQLNYIGGKPDDITIIVAQIYLKEQNESKMIKTENNLNYQLQD